MPIVIEYPQKFEGISSLVPYPNIAKYWSYSVEVLTKINRELNDNFNSKEFAIVVAGSYGRLEASEVSDFDYIILYENEPQNLEEVKLIINDILTKHNIPTPNPTGVFSENIPVPAMIKNIGGGTDSLASLAQRMLILMECRAIYNSSFF